MFTSLDQKLVHRWTQTLKIQLFLSLILGPVHWWIEIWRFMFSPRSILYIIQLKFGRFIYSHHSTLEQFTDGLHFYNCVHFKFAYPTAFLPVLRVQDIRGQLLKRWTKIRYLVFACMSLCTHRLTHMWLREWYWARMSCMKMQLLHIFMKFITFVIVQHINLMHLSTFLQ